MSDSIANVNAPLDQRQPIPLISVKEEQGYARVPQRDAPNDAFANGKHLQETNKQQTCNSQGGKLSSSESGVGQEPSASEDEEDQSSDDDQALYEDLLNDTVPYRYQPGEGICTPEECKYYMKLLRDVGIEEFVNQTISQGTITAKKLCTAFGIVPPEHVLGDSDEDYYKLLGYAISRQLAKREKLDQYNTIDDAAQLLTDSRNILVITGAGISTSLGIPDFRSKETGFYTKLREKGIDEPEELFELSRFDDDPSFFYSFAGETLPDFQEWTPTHQFIKLLQDKGKLLRNYTQNIDNIEANAGVTPDKLVQCHGSWATATCRKCRHKVPCAEIVDDVKTHRVPKCKKCINDLASLSARPVPKRKRSSRENSKARKKSGWDGEDSDSDGQYDIPQPGVMKPDITFFGEPLPDRFFDLIKDTDSKVVDLVIVIGTGLKVAPVSELPGFLGTKVPHIYISRTPIHHIAFDINLLGYCDVVVAELAKRAGWDLHHKMIPADQRVSVTTNEEQHWTHEVERI